MNFFLDIDAWISGVIFFLLMLLGWWFGTKGSDSKEHGSTRTEDAAFALFGLLLAFCFSGAAGKYENRKELLREDAISIGDFATTASVLAEPARTQIKTDVVQYVKNRLVFGETRFDSSRMPEVLSEGKALQDRLLTTVKQAVSDKNTPTIHTPLLNAFNGMTSAHDRRLFGAQNQVPGSIVLMLVLFGFYSAFSMGRLGGSSTRERSTFIRIGSYSALVALVFTVIIDLEQPRRGLMRVSQTPMEDLLASLTAQK